MNNLITGPNKTSGNRNKRKKDVIENADGTDIGNEDLAKKMRTTFTGKQIFELEKSYESLSSRILRKILLKILQLIVLKK